MQARLSKLAHAVVAVLATTAVGIAAAQTVQSELHRNAATLNVMGDPFLMQYARAFYCNLVDDNNQIVIASRGWNNQTGTGSNAQYRVPLTQIFDDVWFVGNHYVGQYLIKTPTGFVQVDAGNSASEVALFNVPAMQSLGLSPTYPLTGVFLTHGHGDHDGGAKYLLDNLGARSYLGSADNNNKSYAPINIDSTDLSFRQMAIGGKTFWVLPTPGHTVGSTSAVVEVMDWGVPRRVLINGGQSMGNTIPPVVSYLTSIERTYVMAKALKVDGVMTPHVYWDGEGVKLNEINATGRTNPSQHIYGHEKVMQQMVIARECSAAWLTRLDATASRSVWRYNKIEFVGNLAPENVRAKLSNGWGPVAGQPVTLSVAETGASCTAVTNAEGIASCKVRPLRPHRDTLKATFAGAETAEFVDLPAETSALVCSNEGVCKN